MTGDNPTNASAKDIGRGRSMIGFPYLYLDDSIEIVKKISDIGSASCSLTQLAEAVGDRATSGAFRMRLNTASKHFGLITFDNELVYLTKLGIEVLAPELEANARRAAFLRVQLYRVMVGEYKGLTPPSAEVIERIFVEHGVAPKQKDKARRAFLGSLKQSGLIDSSTGLISMPSDIESGQNDLTRIVKIKNPVDASVGDNKKAYHPFIEGLMQSLPQPRAEWPIASRIEWVQAALQNFNLIYARKDSDEGDTIEVVRKKA